MKQKYHTWLNPRFVTGAVTGKIVLRGRKLNQEEYELEYGVKEPPPSLVYGAAGRRARQCRCRLPC